MPSPSPPCSTTQVTTFSHPHLIIHISTTLPHQFWTQSYLYLSYSKVASVKLKVYLDSFEVEKKHLATLLKQGKTLSFLGRKNVIQTGSQACIICQKEPLSLCAIASHILYQHRITSSCGVNHFLTLFITKSMY